MVTPILRARAPTLTALARHQSNSQKIVQARMWAQGLTIGILIATGMVTHSQRAETAKNHAVDHSWRELLEAEAREAESRKIKLDRFEPSSATA